MNITVLGGGHGCYAAAVEMAEKGHQTRLWRRDCVALKELLAIGSLTIRDYRGTRQLSVGQQGDKLSLTDDLAEALGDDHPAAVDLPRRPGQTCCAAPARRSGGVPAAGHLWQFRVCQGHGRCGQPEQGRLR